MYPAIVHHIRSFSEGNITSERKKSLQPLVDYIQMKVNNGETIRLNFICTHNSRRSHLSQIWAQTMAFHFNIQNVYCYSGGTEATSLFSKVVETLIHQGFQIERLSETENSIYAIKYDRNANAIICFSKTYYDSFNPQSQFGAIMTCSSADEGCPLVLGAEKRFSIKYDDPKIFDSTDIQTEMYAKRSLEIAQEMWWVFSKIH